MDYIFYFGLAICLLWLYRYLAITVSIIHQYLAERQPLRIVYYISFYTSRVICGYIYASILSTFATHYIGTGLSPVWVLGLSYLALVFWWIFETTGDEAERQSNSIEYHLTVNLQLVILGINTLMFCLLYAGTIPSEPYLSTLVLSIALFLTDFLIIKIAIATWGVFFAFIAGWNLVFPSPRTKDDEKYSA